MGQLLENGPELAEDSGRDVIGERLGHWEGLAPPKHSVCSKTTHTHTHTHTYMYTCMYRYKQPTYTEKEEVTFICIHTEKHTQIFNIL